MIGPTINCCFSQNCKVNILLPISFLPLFFQIKKWRPFFLILPVSMEQLYGGQIDEIREKTDTAQGH